MSDAPLYTGMRLPDGSPFRELQNREQHQDFDNVIMNQNSYNVYLWRLLDIAMSVFEWKNLPTGVDPRMLEFWLLRDGFCAFIHEPDLAAASKEYWTGGKAPEGYAVMQAMIGGHWDMYQYPTNIHAYSVNGLNFDMNEQNAVIIFNSYLRVPMWYSIDLYAKRLAEIDRTIDVNVRAQKTPKVITCDKEQRLSLLNFAKEVDGNKYWIMGSKNLDLDNIDVLDISSPYVGNELQILKHQYWNEALTFLGVENVTTEKKERLVTNEVMSNMGDVEVQRFTRLNARKLACEQINRLFNLEVDCEFRSGIYIKADGFGSQQIATSGMQDGDVPIKDGGYDSVDTSGVMAKLRKLLGV